MGIAKTESVNQWKYSQVQKLEIPDDGLVIQLKSSGGSKYFENIQNATERDTTLFTYLTRMLLNRLADRNLSNSTQFIGELKAIQILNKYVVLNDLWWKNWGHKNSLFSAIRAFTQLELMRAEELIENWYEVQRICPSR